MLSRWIDLKQHIILINHQNSIAHIRDNQSIYRLLYRKFYYSRDESDRAAAEVILAKQRNGPTGTVHLNFYDEWMKFDNPAMER